MNFIAYSWKIDAETSSGSFSSTQARSFSQTLHFPPLKGAPGAPNAKWWRMLHLSGIAIPCETSEHFCTKFALSLKFFETFAKSAPRRPRIAKHSLTLRPLKVGECFAILRGQAQSWRQFRILRASKVILKKRAPRLPC